MLMTLPWGPSTTDECMNWTSGCFDHVASIHTHQVTFLHLNSPPTHSSQSLPASFSHFLSTTSTPSIFLTPSHPPAHVCLHSQASSLLHFLMVPRSLSTSCSSGVTSQPSSLTRTMQWQHFKWLYTTSDVN